MRRPTIPRRCHSCGTLVYLNARAGRDEVTLSWRCPACSMQGGTFFKDQPLEELQRLAEQQNTLAATPEAAAEAERWQDRVAERVAADAALFLELLQNRFPAWRDHLTYEPDPYLGGSKRLTIPSGNPNVVTPLTLCVAKNEVLLSWVDGWHRHISRECDAEQSDRTHLTRALTDIEDLIEERTLTAIDYVDGRPGGGGSLRPEEGIPDNWKERLVRWHPNKPVSIRLRSWRGTYDTEWHSGNDAT